ncbi:hypothetical protein BD309DRAFT_975041 [Dichomitus squalens]|nr:hypothetical protein BD309DRAFT_975041 [Dichomitus squalens]
MRANSSTGCECRLVACYLVETMSTTFSLTSTGSLIGRHRKRRLSWRYGFIESGIPESRGRWCSVVGMKGWDRPEGLRRG